MKSLFKRVIHALLNAEQLNRVMCMAAIRESAARAERLHLGRRAAGCTLACSGAHTWMVY